MNNFNSNQIINLALVGHASSGKTILVDAVLCSSGVINTIGSIENGTTISDYNEYEKECQHSVSLSLVHCESSNKKINIIDAPGYIDFQGEMRSALQVADIALIVVNCFKVKFIFSKLKKNETKRFPLYEIHFFPL